MLIDVSTFVEDFSGGLGVPILCCDLFWFETWVYMIIIDMIDFDVALGIDLLAPYHAILDNYAKTIMLSSSNLPRIAEGNC